MVDRAHSAVLRARQGVGRVVARDADQRMFWPLEDTFAGAPSRTIIVAPMSSRVTNPGGAVYAASGFGPRRSQNVTIVARRLLLATQESAKKTTRWAGCNVSTCQ